MLVDAELQRGASEGELGVAADEAEVGAPHARARCGERAAGQPRGDRLLAAARLQLGGRAVLDDVVGERVGGLADEHTAGRRLGLQPGRGVHHVAHGRVVGAGERADEHLARVDADAELERVGRALVLDVAVDGLLHAQRRPHGALGVVLVGDRGAEQGEDAVAEQLVDPTTERGDVVDQTLEHAVDEPLHLFGVEVLGERGEADHVAEQHGDDAPFLGLTCRDGMAAGGAEARSRGQGRCARGAEHHSRSVRHIHLERDDVSAGRG